MRGPTAVLLALLACVAAAWTVARRLLRVSDAYARFDDPPPPLMKPRDEVGSEIDEVVAGLQTAQAGLGDRARDPAGRRERVRVWLDSMGEQVEHDCIITPVETGPVRGEWVIAPDGDPGARILYLHGGAFEAGSPLSHRSMSTRLASRTGMAVFVLDYRLVPEHHRRDGIADCDAGWAFVRSTGPAGPAAASALVVAGDSAGGNLALSLSLRVRDEGDPQPDAVIACSPIVDATLAAPSWREHIETDPFLGPGFGDLIRLPREVLVLGVWALGRVRPTDPDVSPLLGDLHGLPPTLVHASADEMLLDDAVRFVRAAQAAGSPATLQVWPHMVHAWQAFIDLPEAEEAMDEIERFIRRHRTRPVVGARAGDTTR